MNSVEVRTTNYSPRQKLISKLQKCFVCETLLSKPTSSRSDSECNVACERRTTGKPSSGQMRPARICVNSVTKVTLTEDMNETRNQKSDCDQVKK